MKCDIKIYGIHQRDFLIKPLKEKLKLNDEDVIYDDRKEGGLVLYTLEKAFCSPMDDYITHRLCLPDDMICCDNFKIILNKIVNTHSDKIVCLFPYNFYLYESKYKPQPSPYIRGNGLLCGNGIIMPKQYIKDCFEFIHNEHPYDYDKQREEIVIMDWVRASHKKVINTIPAPVQHIGDDYRSYLPYEVKRNRKTKFFKQDCLTNVNWENKEIVDFPNYDYTLKTRIRDSVLMGHGIYLDENFKPRKEKKENG